jgi:hypothetical protein
MALVAQYLGIAHERKPSARHRVVERPRQGKVVGSNPSQRHPFTRTSAAEPK